MEIPLRLQGAGFLSVGILDLNKWKIYRRAAPRPALFIWADPTFKTKHRRSRVRGTFWYTQTAASRPSNFPGLFGFLEVRFSEKIIFFKGKSRKNAIFSKKTRKNDHFFPSNSLSGFQGDFLKGQSWLFKIFWKNHRILSLKAKKCDYSVSFPQKSVHVFSKHAFKLTLKSPHPCRISTSKITQTQLKKSETCTLFCQLPRKFMCWDSTGVRGF